MTTATLSTAPFSSSLLDLPCLALSVFVLCRSAHHFSQNLRLCISSPLDLDCLIRLFLNVEPHVSHLPVRASLLLAGGIFLGLP